MRRATCIAMTNDMSTLDEAAMIATASAPPGTRREICGQRIRSCREMQRVGETAAHRDQGEDRRNHLRQMFCRVEHDFTREI